MVNPVERSKVLAKFEGGSRGSSPSTEEVEHEKLKRWRFKEQCSSLFSQGSKSGVATLISGKINFECTYKNERY